jgi:hypothetical protein
MPIGIVRRNLEGALISLAHILRGKPRGITLRSNSFITIRLLVSIVISIFIFTATSAVYGSDSNNEKLVKPEFNVYKANIKHAGNFDVYKKGADFELVLLNDINTKSSQNGNSVDFYLIHGNEKPLKATGYISKQSSPMRSSIPASVEFATNKIYLENGDSVNFPAVSHQLSAIHPPHADTRFLGLTRLITGLSVASSPFTVGTSLGVSFLVSGLLSARRNGISDFFWGGLDGIGLSPVENLLRKQPNVYLARGTSIPFTLKEDLKINKGIEKQKNETINVGNEEALVKIQELIDRGDLTGALEMSYKTNQSEKYNEILKKLSL